MFKCWKDSSRDVWLVGFISLTALFWSWMGGWTVAFEARPQQPF